MSVRKRANAAVSAAAAKARRMIGCASSLLDEKSQDVARAVLLA
jgi:hypothetical protein